MKTTLCALCVLCGLNLAASIVSNKVLMVDQHGEINEPGALASTADMAAVKAAALTAEEKAAVAEAAAREGTNLMAGVAADIARNELVVYRYGYTDGFSAANVIDADAELVTTKFDPTDETNASGLQAFDLNYALANSTAYSGQPLIRWRGALNDGTDFEPIDAANVEPVQNIGTWTNALGKVFGYHYSVRFYDEAATQGFYLVTLIPDDAAGDGAALDLPNGVRNGITTEFEWDGYKLFIEGGAVVGVREVTW